MDKETLRTKLKEIRAAQEALPGRFWILSAKKFTYEPPRYWDTERNLKIKRIHRKGEHTDDFFWYLNIRPDGAITDFSFYSFSGENDIELNEARVYIRDCEELLSREFAEKVAADYKTKADEFESLMAQEKAICEQIMQIEKEGGAAK